MSFWSTWRAGPAPILDPAPDVEAELAAPFVGPLGYGNAITGVYSAGWPYSRADVYDRYGNPGSGTKADRAWERANMVSARNLPGRWNGGKGKLYIHRLAEPYLREALRRAGLLVRSFTLGDTTATELLLNPTRTATALDYITRLGCFSFRHQRHDPARPLSYHSWGIAVDINSDDNAGWYVKKPPEPWSPEWMKHYPRGVPRELVRAFESVGWKWGGRWTGYCDPMHFELVA